MENRFIELNNDNLSGILTLGGTMLGASRDKPHRMPIAGRKADMTDIMVENFEKHRLMRWSASAVEARRPAPTSWCAKGCG